MKFQIEVLKSKIHRVSVTQADLNYVGSITIDEELMDAANMIEGEKVQVLDVDNGERLETYIIKGERGSAGWEPSQPSSGGAVVKAAVRVSSGVPPFVFLSLSGFPLGAGRKGSVVGGAQRAFSSRRTGAGSPGRAFALAAQKPGAGRGRWAGPPRGGRGFGAAGFSPAGNASFALVGQKSKPQNGEQKKTFRRPNVAVS